MSGDTMRQNDDGRWVPATPLPRQGKQMDWEVTRESNRWVGRGYDAEDTLVHVVRSRWRLHLDLKMRVLSRFS